jgi:uncharacterized protein with NRDE domain
MCLLALLYRVVDDAAVVVGANREEYYQRGGEPPRLLPGSIPAVAGIDPLAGGTWLGVNVNSVLVAVTNRPKLDVPANPRSRGRLAREMLGYPSVEAAADHAIRALEHDAYAGANYLCVDEQRAIVIQAGDWLRIRLLPPGIHVLTNRDINDAGDARLSYALEWLKGRTYRSAMDCIDALSRLCAKHEPDNPPICFRGSDRGTVSSTLVALAEELGKSLYLHAQGPPSDVPYEDYSRLLRELSVDCKS